MFDKVNKYAIHGEIVCIRIRITEKTNLTHSRTLCCLPQKRQKLFSIRNYLRENGLRVWRILFSSMVLKPLLNRRTKSMVSN